MTPQQRFSESRDQKNESRPVVTTRIDDNSVIDSMSIGKSFVDRSSRPWSSEVHHCPTPPSRVVIACAGSQTKPREIAAIYFSHD